jgi:phosphate-selective porin OprO and OprP
MEESLVVNKLLSYSLCAVLIASGRNVVADDATFEQILSRLQQTEQRLMQLEQQKSSPFRSASNPYTSNRPLALPFDVEGNAEKKSDEDGEDEKDEEPTLEDRMKKLEEGWKELDGAWSAFDKAEKKKKADAAKKPTFKIGGRIHADFWDFINDDGGVGFLENPVAGDGSDTDPLNDGSDPDDRFAFRRIRLEMGGDIKESMLWRTQIDFNKPGTGEMKDIYIGFKNLPNNQLLLIGNQKRPLGLDHLNSSRYNVFTERPFVVEAFNEDARRPGICMYGNTDDLKYNWRYGAYYLENITSDGASLGDQRQMSANFRLASSPWYDECSDGRGYLHWAVAGMFAKPDGNDTKTDGHSNEARFRTRPEARSNSRWLNTGRIPGAEWYETLGVEGIVNIGALQVAGEYMHNFMQRDGFADTQFGGGYIYANYMLTGEHIPYDRDSGTIGRLVPFEDFFLMNHCCGGKATGWGAWGVAARYSYLDVSDADVLGGVGESASLAINWYWTAFSKMQFNLVYGDIDDRDPLTGTTGGSYLIAGTRFAVEF